MLTPGDEAKIVLWNAGLPGTLNLDMVITDDPRSAELCDFCRDLAQAASNVEVTEVQGKTGALPAIRVAGNLRFCGVPAGRELEPFLESVRYHDGGTPAIEPGILDRMAGVNVPARLRLYVGQQCPHCPGSVRQLALLTVASPFVTLDVIDGSLFDERARADDVQSVPTLFLNDGIRWTGPVPLHEVVDMLASPDPSGFDAATFDRILHEGGAESVARMILEKGEMFAAFVDLLVDDKFRTRLGAMTVMEEVARENAVLAAQAVDPLWERFGQAIEPVQIDILYLFGDAGTQDTIPRLESVTDGEYREHVKEVARESIERIRERTG